MKLLRFLFQPRAKLYAVCLLSSVLCLTAAPVLPTPTTGAVTQALPAGATQYDLISQGFNLPSAFTLRFKSGSVFQFDAGATFAGSTSAFLAAIGATVAYVPQTTTVNGHALSANVAVTKADVGLGSVENTALSTWPGTGNITTVGTLASGAVPASLLTGTVAAAHGGFGADVSSQSGVPLFATGVATFTGTNGTGNFARVTSPTFVTPALGAATATTLNALTLTAAATGFTVAGGTASKTLTVSNTLTLAGTDATTMTFPSTSATLARTDAANTFTGHQTIEGVTSTGATGTGNLVYSITPTLTGSPVVGGVTFSASAATALNSITAASATALTLGPGTNGTSLVLNTGASGGPTFSLANDAIFNVTTASSGHNPQIRLLNTDDNQANFVIGTTATTSGTTAWQFKIQYAGGFNFVQALDNFSLMSWTLGHTAATMGLTISSPSRFSDATNATNSASGALQIGNTVAATTVGIGGGNIFAGGTVNVGSSTASTSTTTGALQVVGGVGIQGALWAGAGNFGNNLTVTGGSISVDGSHVIQSTGDLFMQSSSTSNVIRLRGGSTTWLNLVGAGTLDTGAANNMVLQVNSSTALTLANSTLLATFAGGITANAGTMTLANSGTVAVAWGSGASTSGSAARIGSGTFSDAAATGNVTSASGTSFNTVNMQAGAATTITDFAAVYIGGGGNNVSNVTFSNNWSLWTAGKIRVDSAVNLTSTNGSSNGGLIFGTSGGDAFLFRSASGTLNIPAATASTSTTTGALVLSGASAGLGVAGNAWIGGTGNFASNVTITNGGVPQLNVLDTRTQAGGGQAILQIGTSDQLWDVRTDGTGLYFKDQTAGINLLVINKGAASVGYASIGSTVEATTIGAGSLTTAGGIYAAKKIVGNTDIIAGGVIQHHAYIASGLPAASSYPGGICYVTDATATTRLSIVAGTGSNHVMVFSDGTNWLIL